MPSNPARSLTFNVNGVATHKNNAYRRRGVELAVAPHVSAFVPTLDAIDTVNVVTNSFDAEQGLAGGAAVNVQIRSGTNGMHGSAFEFHTDNHTKAKPFFLPVGQDKPEAGEQRVRRLLGGPVKHDKLFYFLSYEGNYNRELATRFGTVPTAAMERGTSVRLAAADVRPLDRRCDGREPDDLPREPDSGEPQKLDHTEARRPDAAAQRRRADEQLLRRDVVCL